jgi:ATP-binding cassette subfamily B protein
MAEHRELPIKQTAKFYLRHMIKYKGPLIAALIMVPVSNILLFQIPPLLLSGIVQRLSTHDYIGGNVWASFGGTLVLYAGLTLVAGVILWRITVYIIWSLELRVQRSIHREVLEHLMSMSTNFHANRFGGTLVSQATKLSSAYINIANTTVYALYTLFIAFIVSAVILFPRVPFIAVALILLSIIFMVVTTLGTRPVRRLRAEYAETESKQIGILADNITNIAAVKSFAGGGDERNLYARATRATQMAGRKVLRASTIRDAVSASANISIGIIVVVMAVVAVVAYGADIGTAFLVLTYSGLIGARLWEFSQVSLREYNRGFGDARDMIEILAIPPEVKDPEHPEAPRITKGAINFIDMSFTHPDSRENETLFEHFNLRIAPGEKAGLVGQSGAGKTTLTKLLLRFHNIDGGAITIDGQNIANITQDDLRRHVAYVPQEPLLFHRTIAENIAYGKPDASNEEIRAAAKKAHALEFVGKLPKGFDTLVGERGVKLSGGQRQRIAIARAILKDAPILLLDEATSALDSESESVIQAALWELMKGRTTIVIAHRLSTIQRMDRIVVLDDGAIIEEGSHAALLKQKGTYAKLWAHQSGGFIN